MSGYTTTDLTVAPLADEVIVNRDGTTARQRFADMATQLAGSGPLADLLAAKVDPAALTPITARLSNLEATTLDLVPSYASTIDGLADTAEGALFRVHGDGVTEAYKVYRHDSGPVAAELYAVPTPEAMAARAPGGEAAAPAGGDAFVFADSSGGALGMVTATETILPGVAGSEDGTGRIGAAEIAIRSGSGHDETDASGGSYMHLFNDGLEIGGLYIGRDAVIAPTGEVIHAAPLPAWIGPGATDAHYTTPVAAVTDVSGYTFPVMTSDRHYRVGYDLAAQEAVCIPTIAAWPNRMIRVNYGLSGVGPNVSPEADGNHLRICVDNGDAWRPVAYVVPPNWETGGIWDSYIFRLRDGRALLIITHDAGEAIKHAVCRVLGNPQDDPINWVWGPWCHIGRGFASLPTYLDNGDLVGAIAAPAIGLSAPYADPLLGNRYGWYHIDGDGLVAWTEMSMIPDAEPGATYNSYAETMIVQSGANALQALFRTTAGYFIVSSTDRGATWGVPTPWTAIQTVSAKCFVSRLPDGRLVALHSRDPTKRYNMWLYVWSDPGAPVSAQPDVEMQLSAHTWVSYPCAAAVPDARGLWRGDLVIAYDHGRNKTANPGSAWGYWSDLIDGRVNIISLSKGFRHLIQREISQ